MPRILIIPIKVCLRLKYNKLSNFEKNFKVCFSFCLLLFSLLRMLINETRFLGVGHHLIFSSKMDFQMIIRLLNSIAICELCLTWWMNFETTLIKNYRLWWDVVRDGIFQILFEFWVHGIIFFGFYWNFRFCFQLLKG